MRRYALDARTATAHFPGIGRYTSNLANGIAAELAADEQLWLLCDRTQPTPWQLPAASEQVHYLETAVSPFGLAQQWQIPRLLRQHGIGLYHSPYYLMPYRLPLPTLLTVYDLIPQLFPHYVSWRARGLFRAATWLALRQAQHLIVISQATLQDVATFYRFGGESSVLPLAADGRFRPQSAAAVAQVRQQYGLPDSYVLYVGSNKPHKNLERLVAAWQLASHGRAAMPLLVIAGAWDGRYPQAQQLVAALGLTERVRFLGQVAEEALAPLYGGAYFFVFPSLYEGFGLPVIEAMACGTAVVCAQTASLAEVAGEAALRIDPTDVGDMAQQLAYLLDHPEAVQLYGQKGLAQASRFSWRQTAVATLDLYRYYCKRP